MVACAYGSSYMGDAISDASPPKQDSIWKIKQKKGWGDGIAQVVKHLCSKHKVDLNPSWSSNPSIAKIIVMIVVWWLLNRLSLLPKVSLHFNWLTASAHFQAQFLIIYEFWKPLYPCINLNNKPSKIQ
jgi:hypothetical protein